MDAYTNSGWVIGTLNKGRVWVRLEDESGNIIHRKMINGDELKNYLNLGWSEGIGHVENRSTIEGLIYVHRKLENDRFEKTYITPDKVEDYINSGWILGCEQKGKKRVHRTNSDGKEEIRTVSEDEYDSYLADGWKPGYTDDHSRFATQTGRKKIFKWLDDGSLKLLSVKKEEFEYYINNGWSSGNIQPNKLGLILVSKRVKGDKKVEQIYIPESLVNKYIDEGWRLGKIK